MPDSPARLDDLISYVRAVHPDGDALARLADAVVAANEIEDNADALVGFFVDQARSSGATWSQIGASMGVSKQAAQKRFVARDEDPSLDDLVPGGRAKLFSRFTRRARDAVAAAARSAQAAGSPEVQPAHLFAGSISDPAAIATKAVRRLGVSDQQVYEALGVSAPAGDRDGEGDADPSALRQHPFSESAKESLRSALKFALRLGHNYIGTEHILLGVLSADPDTAAHLATVGISPQLAEKALAVEMAQFMLENEQRATG
jgi:hypothetical protein